MKNELEADMEKDVVLCEVPYGGMLLINNCIPHKRYVSLGVIYITKEKSVDRAVARFFFKLVEVGTVPAYT